MEKKNQMIEYQLIRSKRKTVAVCVKEDGSVEVRAPGWVSRTEIQKFIGEKSDWIRKKQQEAADKNCVRQKYYTEGAVFLCMEKEYRLHIVESKRNAVYVQELEGSLLIVKTRSLEETYIRELLIKWSAEQLKRCVQAAVERYLPRLAEFAEKERYRQEEYAEGSSRMRMSAYLMQYRRAAAGRAKAAESVKPCVMREITGITVKNVKTRWGSCSAKGHLNFSVKLVMAPAEIIDYVIVHELCHLLYMNHGPKFWSAVAAILPDCQKRRKYLKENGWRYEF